MIYILTLGVITILYYNYHIDNSSGSQNSLGIEKLIIDYDYFSNVIGYDYIVLYSNVIDYEYLIVIVIMATTTICNYRMSD